MSDRLTFLVIDEFLVAFYFWTKLTTLHTFLFRWFKLINPRSNNTKNSLNFSVTKLTRKKRKKIYVNP